MGQLYSRCCKNRASEETEQRRLYPQSHSTADNDSESHSEANSDSIAQPVEETYDTTTHRDLHPSPVAQTSAGIIRLYEDGCRERQTSSNTDCELLQTSLQTIPQNTENTDQSFQSHSQANSDAIAQPEEESYDTTMHRDSLNFHGSHPSPMVQTSAGIIPLHEDGRERQTSSDTDRELLQAIPLNKESTDQSFHPQLMIVGLPRSLPPKGIAGLIAYPSGDHDTADNNECADGEIPLSCIPDASAETATHLSVVTGGDNSMSTGLVTKDELMNMHNSEIEYESNPHSTSISTHVTLQTASTYNAQEEGALLQLQPLSGVQGEKTGGFSGIKCPLPNSIISSHIHDHNGGILTSEYGDIKITIPKGAIHDGDTVTFYAAAGFYGPFVLPSQSQTDLLSPYYWIGVSVLYYFQ